MSVPLKDHDSAPWSDLLLRFFAQSPDDGTRDLGLSASRAVVRAKILDQPQKLA